MLVITRRIGETVIIGDDIKVTLVSGARSGQARIGICDPREVPVQS